LKIAVAQIHSIAGDIEGNSHKLVEAIKEAKEQGARIVVTPEMAITGYPVEDLLGDQEFLTQAELATYRVARTVGDIYALIGSPMRAGAIEESLIVHPIDSLARDVYNAVVVAHNGEIIATHTKSLLPTYGVFDDSRWMVAGPVEQELINIDGVLCGLAVCEDVWTKEVALAASAKGAEILLVPNASPYHIGKPAYRLELLTELARDSKMTIVYANSVGGQDEVVYDGGSVIMKEDGVVQLSAPLFKEGVWSVDLDDAPVILRDKSDNDSETWIWFAGLCSRQWFYKCHHRVIWRYRFRNRSLSRSRCFRGGKCSRHRNAWALFFRG
jgi:NAD+ synthase (glutamine-hydrolysing)